MDAENLPVYKDRTSILALIGFALLLVGAAAAFLGPVEIYCFYLFSEGGRFYYEGFRFGSLMVFMHVPLFFNGIFPLFGSWLSDMQGFVALDCCIISLVGLTWGVLRQRVWAWWGSVAYFGLLTLSAVVTLARSSLAEMLSLMKFAPLETGILQGMPLQGVHFIPFLGIPLLITLGVILLSKRHFVR